jgi:hypothetical protein
VDEVPEYGPRGYLPPRAARRARKIVLRERMGLQWPVAAVVAGVLVVLVGAVYLLRSGPPGAPFVPLGPVPAVEGVTPARAAGDPLLVAVVAGRVGVFADPGVPVTWCAASRRLESPDGRVWTPEGILVGGDGASLRPVPSTVHGGELYADPRTATDLPPDPRGERPACGNG